MFSKKIVYYVKEKNGLKIAPKKVVIFNWIRFNHDNFKNIKKIEYIFLKLSNIFFNFEDFGLLKYAMDDIKKYWKINYIKDSVLTCSYSKQRCDNDFIITKLDYNGQYGKLGVSFNISDINFAKSLSKTFFELLFWFYRMPNDDVKKELKRFEEYLKLMYNIRKFDMEYLKINKG